MAPTCPYHSCCSTGSALKQMQQGLYLNWKKSFSMGQEQEMVCFELSDVLLLRPLCSAVPVIAILTKFDDLITQIYDGDKTEDENKVVALGELKEKFEKPLMEYKFPPKAHMYTEGMLLSLCDHGLVIECWSIFRAG